MRLPEKLGFRLVFCLFSEVFLIFGRDWICAAVVPIFLLRFFLRGAHKKQKTEVLSKKGREGKTNRSVAISMRSEKMTFVPTFSYLVLGIPPLLGSLLKCEGKIVFSAPLLSC